MDLKLKPEPGFCCNCLSALALLATAASEGIPQPYEADRVPNAASKFFARGAGHDCAVASCLRIKVVVELTGAVDVGSAVEDENAEGVGDMLNGVVRAGMVRF
ncbi:hypothetical protein DAEQUDRAFT_733905 [Daedalea quercina L-15889]|uniref:Uncharacterized protein n=1 Tax=Daedalea quercina L-15889 TaxID=1314783 RepID=A0A165KNH6_9APHY|nr:hypothetical protein DAEQUDRAFT_733905 [Daedalea quercina L-15889]